MYYYEEIRKYSPHLFFGGKIMRENKFQSDLIKEIKDRYPGSIVLKNDPRYKKGIPDLTVLYKNKWGSLECKKEERSSKRPGQENYISRMNEMSFAKFVCPENKEEVLSEMDKVFKVRRVTRSSKSK